MAETMPKQEQLDRIQSRWIELKQLDESGEVSDPQAAADEVLQMADQAGISHKQLFEILYPKKEQK